MRNDSKTVLGFEVPQVGIAESFAELAQLAGSEEAGLALANNYVSFHVHNTSLRAGMVKKLEELTGVSRHSVKDGDKVKITETDNDYVVRLRSEVGDEVVDSYAPQMSEVATGIPMDYTKKVRGTGAGSTIAKKWIAFYDKMVEEDKLDAFIEKFNINPDLEGDELKHAVANKVKEVVTKQVEAATKAALAVI